MELSEISRSSRLSRDADYRMCALTNAVNRAGQDGGIQGEDVNLYGLAEGYYAWLKGERLDTQKPEEEISDATVPSA